MNPYVNRSSQPENDSGKQKSEYKNPSPNKVKNQEKANTGNETKTTQKFSDRLHPVPPPSNPRQYRAIGLIKGKYKSSQEQLTQGMLLDDQGKEIEAVLLGRVISLVKNHLDLDKDHVWVVYPHTKKENDELHLQIVGIWEPETLNQNDNNQASNVQEGYFSIRGEVIFYSREKEMVIVKIRQSPKKQSERPKFFKLKLKGTLPEKPINHFWDLQVLLEDNVMHVKEATDLGPLMSKKKPFDPQKKYPPKSIGGTRSSDSYTSSNETLKPIKNPMSFEKPTKRKKD